MAAASERKDASTRLPPSKSALEIFEDLKGESESKERVGPSSPFVDAMLTDLYQITMCYALWKGGRQDDDSVFDLYFRKNPFKGEFTIFAGLEEVLRHVQTFGFRDSDIAQLKARFPTWDQSFWPYLAGLNTSKVRVYAIAEGSLVFPAVPLIRIEGPLAVCQLLETTLLCLVNFASLIATNAARMRLAVGPEARLLEFGLRRAQGPDGAISASRYAYLGGFDGTSNVKAATMFGFQMSGTHAHSFVTTYCRLEDLKERSLLDAKGNTVDFLESVLKWRQRLGKNASTNPGELAAFVAYAQAFPTGFLALVDTYDTLESGLWNFLSVALALHQCGYAPVGIRLDSGDLAYLSKECRKAFIEVSDQYGVDFGKLSIVASNDLSEEVLWALKEQGHSIDTFGVGTHLVTCKSQPALGCVYKLVQVRGLPRMKISQEVAKITIPGRKEAFRLFNAVGEPVVDLLINVGEAAPVPTHRILCRHPFAANKRAYVTPSKVERLHELFWDGKLVKPLPNLRESRERVRTQIACMRSDHLRRINPTPYKISVSGELYTFMHELWLRESPVAEIV